ncbi:hypothetical protein Aperf_G00000086889 [Anoplocephala perfoliata]
MNEACTRLDCLGVLVDVAAWLAVAGLLPLSHTTIGRQPFPLALTLALALALLLDAAVDSRHFCARQSVRGLSVLASRCYALAATTSPGNGCEAGSYCDRETERCVLVDVAAWLAVAGLLPLSHTTIGRQPFPLALTLALALALLLDAAVDSRHFCARQSVRGLSVLASRCYALAATTSPGNGCEAGSYCDRETERCVLVDVAAWLAVAGLLPLSHTTIGRQPFPLALTLALALLLDAAVDSRHFCARQSVRGLSVLASRCYALAATTSPGNGCEAGSYCDRETERC